MSATTGQSEHSIHDGPTSGGDVGLDRLYPEDIIDWNNLDSIPDALFNSIAASWDCAVEEVAIGEPMAAETSNAGPGVDVGRLDLFGTPSSTGSQPPDTEYLTVKEAAGNFNDLEFSNFESDLKAGRPSTDGDFNISTDLYIFDTPPSSPQGLRPTTRAATHRANPRVANSFCGEPESNPVGGMENELERLSRVKPFILEQQFGLAESLSHHPPDNNQKASSFPASRTMSIKWPAGNAAGQACSSEDCQYTESANEIDFDGRRSKTKSESVNAELSRTRIIRLAKLNPNFEISGKYTPLLSRPRPWHVFTYNEHGELNPEDLFTAEQVQHYLWRHPLHKMSPDRRNSPLTLRIHRTPPASQNRYPTNHGSHRCRFNECPADNNTIDKGQIVVMFDEISALHPNHDPYLTAGYVHLYCIERFLNFPMICATLNVQTEKRRLAKESKNLMRLDPKQMEEEACTFIKTCRQLMGKLSDGYPGFDKRDQATGQPYDRTLNHRLHVAKMTNRPGSINRQEVARGKAGGQKGSNIGTHMGDLVLATLLRQSTRRHAKQNQLIANPRHRRRYKGDGVEDQSDNYFDGLEQRRAEADDRVKQLRAPLPPLITFNAHMRPSTNTQHGDNGSIVTCGGAKPILAPRYSMDQLDENRKFIMPSNVLLLPDSVFKSQPFEQHQEGQQPMNGQRPALVSSNRNRKRSSAEAGNDEAAPHNSHDVEARPPKKAKNSHASMPPPISERQAHQRQALQKLANSRPLPPPPATRQASELPLQKVGRPTFQPFPPSSSQAGNKRTANEAGLTNTPVPVDGVFAPVTDAGVPDARQMMKLREIHSPSISAPMRESPSQGFPVGSMPSASTSLIPASGHQQVPYLSSPRQGYAPLQHHPYDSPPVSTLMQHPPNGYHPQAHLQQRPPPGYHSQKAPETAKARRQRQLNYERYMQKTKSRALPAPTATKQRKRPAEVPATNGKVMKKKARLNTHAPEIIFGNRNQESLLREQRKLFENAGEGGDDNDADEDDTNDSVMDEEEIRADEERASTIIQQETAAEETAARYGNQTEQLRTEAEREEERRRIEALNEEALNEWLVSYAG